MYAYAYCSKCGEAVSFSHDDHGDIIAKCPKCNPEPPSYTTHCWNCYETINPAVSIKSTIPGMGYKCNYCGKDLLEWKFQKGYITFHHYLQLKGANYAVL